MESHANVTERYIENQRNETANNDLQSVVFASFEEMTKEKNCSECGIIAHYIGANIKNRK